MKIAYISGKYRDKSLSAIDENIQLARRAAKHLWSEGWAVICPHSNTAFMDGVCPDEQFLNGDLSIINRLNPGTDAMFMLPNWEDSEGARREREVAHGRMLRVYYMTEKEL